jgi:hypothetical protein
MISILHLVVNKNQVVQICNTAFFIAYKYRPINVMRCFRNHLCQIYYVLTPKKHRLSKVALLSSFRMVKMTNLVRIGRYIYVQSQKLSNTTSGPIEMLLLLSMSNSRISTLIQALLFLNIIYTF